MVDEGEASSGGAGVVEPPPVYAATEEWKKVNNTFGAVQCSAERYVNSLGRIELKFEYCNFVWRLKFPEYLTAVVVIVKYFSGFNVFC